MAVCTIAPLTLMSTGVDWEILTVMIPVRRLPGSGVMAGIALCRKMRCQMIGIAGLIIVLLVTTDTFRGSIAIIRAMTLRTGQTRMGAAERKTG